MSKKGAIITGAASGVGLALTKHYLAQGWRVVMSDINPAGEAIAKELGDDVLFIPSDTSSWESQAALFEKAFAWHREITLLAANAGIRSNSAAMRTPDEGDVPKKPSLKVLDVNINGPVYGIKLFVHYIQKHNPAVPEDGSAKASVIITASQGGFYPLPLDAIYCASKHALVGLVRSLGPFYLKQYGISINSINPGYIKTPLMSAASQFIPDHMATPFETVVAAFDELINGNKSGQTLELSGKNMYYQKQQEFPDDTAAWLWRDR